MNLLPMNEPMTARLLASTLTTFSPFGKSRNQEFAISNISPDSITFLKQNGKEQTARRKEIEFVAENWNACKSGDVTRRELQKKSFNTSYIFGVLHFIENELK